MASRADRAEAKAVVDDRAAQETAGAAAHDVGVQSPGYIHGIHPEHGEAVCYVPGELLPAWVVTELKAGRSRTDEHGRITLTKEPS